MAQLTEMKIYNDRISKVETDPKRGDKEEEIKLLKLKIGQTFIIL